MAFLSDDTVVTEIQEKMNKLSDVASLRDQIFADNEDKPMKIIIAAVIGGWLIYHFLIKR